MSLMAAGKREFFSLVVLDLKPLDFWPKGSSVNSPCWGWVGSLRMEASLLWTCCGRCSAVRALEFWWSAVLYTLCRCLRSKAEAVPDGGTAGQDYLNNAAVEVGEDLRWHAKLPQPPQNIHLLLDPFTSCLVVFEWPSEVITDVDAQVSDAAHPLLLKLSDVQWPMRPLLLPHVNLGWAINRQNRLIQVFG